MSVTAWDAWAELMVHAAVKAGLLLLVALAVVTAGSRLSAARRHLILCCALSASLVVPLLWTFLPGWGLARERVAADAEATALSGAGAGERISEAPKGKMERAGAAAWDAAEIVRPGWRPPLFCLWSGGVLLFAISGLRARQLRRRLEGEARPATEPALRESLRACMDQLGLCRPVEVLVAPGAIGPMTWGLARPRILLPRDAARWSTARRRVVLLHELAHVRRRDGWSRLLAEAAVALLWFHPLVWIATLRLREEAERACDDLVLAQGVRPSRYLGELVALAREMRHRAGPQPVLGFVRRRGLAGRAAAIAAAGCSRRAPSAVEAVMTAAVTVLCAVALAGLGKAPAAATATAGEPLSSTPSLPDVQRDFRALTRDADRGAFLERLVLEDPSTLPVVLSLAPEVEVDAVLEPLLQRILASGVEPGLLAPFLAATSSLDADAARQTVLVELASSHRLPEPALVGAIRAAAGMRAVAARADTLVTIARSQARSPAAVEEIRRAALDLDRPSARRAVFAALSD